MGALCGCQSSGAKSDDQAPLLGTAEKGEAGGESSLPVDATTKSAIIGGITWLGASALQSTWSTSSTTVMIPSAFGALGYVGGPIVLLLNMGLKLWVELAVVDLVLRHPEQKFRRLGDVGEYLGGPLFGSILTALQLLNNGFFMPCALTFAAHSLRDVMKPYGSSCNLYWSAIVCVVAFIVLQLYRNFSHSSAIAFVTCIFCVVQVACIDGIATATEAKDGPEVMTGFLQLDVYTYQSIAPFSSPSFAGGLWTEDFSNWIGAFGTLTYGFVPCFVTVEIMSEMKHPEHMKFALYTASTFMAIIYLTVGLVPLMYWGANLDTEITDMLPDNSVGKLAAFSLLLATLVDFLIASVAVNNQFRATFAPASWPTNVSDDFSRSGYWHWAVLTVPVMLLTLAFTVLIPHLNSLIGILSAFAIPAAQMIVPSWLLLTSSKNTQSNSMMAKLLFVLAILLGLGCVFFIMIGTVYSIVTASYKGNFFCSLAGN